MRDEAVRPETWLAAANLIESLRVLAGAATDSTEALLLKVLAGIPLSRAELEDMHEEVARFRDTLEQYQRTATLAVLTLRSLAEDAQSSEVTTLRTMSAQATSISTDSRFVSGDDDGAMGPMSLDLQTGDVNYRTIEGPRSHERTGSWSQDREGGDDPQSEAVGDEAVSLMRVDHAAADRPRLHAGDGPSL